jgi:translation elongation factor EF-1alpha
MDTEKFHTNIVFIGDVDSDKSTTAVHLIYKSDGFYKEFVKKIWNEISQVSYCLIS